MLEAQLPALDEEELMHLNGAAEKHSDSVIDLVTSRLLAGSNMHPFQIETLTRLWKEQLQDLKAPTKVALSQSHVDIPDGQGILTHPRLLEHVRNLQPVFGCTGRPAPYLKPPEYPSQQKKSDRKWKVEEDMGKSKRSKNSTKRSQRAQGSDELPVPAASDLVLGMMVHVDLAAFLQIAPFSTEKEEGHWVAGRVVSIVKPPNPSRASSGARTNTVKIRFPNGGEIETHWPRNSLLLVPDVPLRESSTLTEENAAQSSGAVTETADSIFASLLQGGDCSDDDLDDELLALQSGGDEALRILLGGDDDYDLRDAGILGGSGSAGTVTTPSLQSQRSLAIDAQLQSVHSDQVASGAPDLSIAQFSGGVAEEAKAHREVALLATGERVPAFSLEEIEQKFENYRPKFKITPDQGDAGLEIQASVRRDRSFASRQWTSAPAAGTRIYSSSEETGLETQLLDVSLSAAEDPALPLPEPDAVFIGKVSKQLRRGEGQWRAQLFDVAMRDLRRDTSTSASTSVLDTSAAVGQGADLILPRCSVSLDPTPLFPLEHVVFGSSGGDSDTQLQDPVARENRALLLALCSGAD